MPGPGHRVEISDSSELCIVELTRVDFIYKKACQLPQHDKF